MKVLQSKRKLPVLKFVEHSLCECFIFGKQKKICFSKIEREPKTKKLELIHIDVWGL